MKQYLLSGIFLLFAVFILTAGCTEPPVKEPTVEVTDIALSDVSLQSMTVNTTVNIYNPNPVGATLNKVAFDVYYVDDASHYLGHGEQTGIMVKENGNTTVTIPVNIGNIQALQAVGSLVKEGSIVLRVNGSAFIDLKVYSYELPFERSRQFEATQFTSLLPELSVGGTTINITEGLGQARGLLNALSG
jgi:LEA14-like dessication related protein